LKTKILIKNIKIQINKIFTMENLVKIVKKNFFNNLCKNFRIYKKTSPSPASSKRRWRLAAGRGSGGSRLVGTALSSPISSEIKSSSDEAADEKREEAGLRPHFFGPIILPPIAYKLG
jgi:hypothetical protein